VKTKRYCSILKNPGFCLTAPSGSESLSRQLIRIPRRRKKSVCADQIFFKRNGIGVDGKNIPQESLIKFLKKLNNFEGLSAVLADPLTR
jgi:hypothetical protein